MSRGGTGSEMTNILMVELVSIFPQRAEPDPSVSNSGLDLDSE